MVIFKKIISFIFLDIEKSNKGTKPEMCPVMWLMVPSPALIQAFPPQGATVMHTNEAFQDQSVIGIFSLNFTLIMPTLIWHLVCTSNFTSSVELLFLAQLLNNDGGLEREEGIIPPTQTDASFSLCAIVLHYHFTYFSNWQTTQFLRTTPKSCGSSSVARND